MKWLCILTLVTAAVGAASAQGTRADFERAKALWNTTRDKLTHDKVEPNWFDGDRRFWYRSNLGNGKFEFIVVDAEAGRREPAFDHAIVAKALGKDIDPAKLPIHTVEFRPGGIIRF